MIQDSKLATEQTGAAELIPSDPFGMAYVEHKQRI